MEPSVRCTIRIDHALGIPCLCLTFFIFSYHKTARRDESLITSVKWVQLANVSFTAPKLAHQPAENHLSILVPTYCQDQMFSWSVHFELLDNAEWRTMGYPLFCNNSKSEGRRITKDTSHSNQIIILFCTSQLSRICIPGIMPTFNALGRHFATQCGSVTARYQ